MGLSWPDLLEYEYGLRKEAFRTVNRQKIGLAESLEQARDDSRLFQEYFSLQICTSGKKRQEATADKQQSKTTTADNDSDNKRKQSLDSELGQIKKRRAKLQAELRQSRTQQPTHSQSFN